MRSFCVRPERLRVVVGSDLRGDDGLNLLRGTLLSAVCLGAEIHQTIMLESGRKLICVDQSRDQAIPSAGCAVVIAFRPSDCIITT